MGDKYLYFTLHIAFAYLDTFWSAYKQKKKKKKASYQNYFGYACDDSVKHLIYFQYTMSSFKNACLEKAVQVLSVRESLLVYVRRLIQKLVDTYNKHSN